MEQRKPYILFVAGDGASGRIMCEAEERLRKEFKTCLFVQENGGAARLCADEGRPYFLLHRVEDIAAHVGDVDLVVVAHSKHAYQIEVTACLAAFERGKPCVKVFDHPQGTNHPYLSDVVRAWEAKQKPSSTWTAITPLHAKLIRDRFPTFTGEVRVIGNPLHTSLEDLLGEGRENVRERLRAQHGLPRDAEVIALFLSGNTDKQFKEMIAPTEDMARGLATRRACLVADLHHVNKNLQSLFDEYVQKWGDAGVAVVTGVPQDEMIAMSDAIVTSPFSTTTERGLALGNPVIQIGGTETEKALEQLTGRSFPDYSPELQAGAVLWTKPRKNHRSWEDLFSRAFDPKARHARLDATKACGNIPEPGAMARLLTLVRSLVPIRTVSAI